MGSGTLPPAELLRIKSRKKISVSKEIKTMTNNKKVLQFVADCQAFAQPD